MSLKKALHVHPMRRVNTNTFGIPLVHKFQNNQYLSYRVKNFKANSIA